MLKVVTTLSSSVLDCVGGVDSCTNESETTLEDIVTFSVDDTCCDVGLVTPVRVGVESDS